MTSAVTTQKIASKNIVQAYYDKNGSAAAHYMSPDGTVHHWLDMENFEYVGFSACNADLTGNGITLMEIWAAIDSSGTSATAIVSSGTLSGTTIEKGGFIECSAAQIKEVGDANSLKFRYATLKITVANNSDTCAIAAIRSGAKAPAQNLTPATM